jgi:hypothetical protein
MENVKAKYNNFEYFKEITLKLVAKFEILVRMFALLTGIHYIYKCWRLGIIMDIYLQFVLNIPMSPSFTVGTLNTCENHMAVADIN